MNIKQIESLIISENKKEIEQYGEGFLLRPIENIDVYLIATEMKIKFNHELDNDYLDLLRVSDGFSVNGLNIFGSKPFNNKFFLNSIYDANIDLWEDESLRKYILYGEESSTRLVFNLESNHFEAVDTVTWDKLEQFNCFSELLNFVITDSCIF